MQSPPQEQPRSNPVSTSATEQQLNAGAQLVQTEPGAPDETAVTPEKSPTGREFSEIPAGTTVSPLLENEPGDQSGAEVVSRATTAKPSVSTKAVPDAKMIPGSDGQKAKTQIKGESDGRKYVLSKKAMVDPLKMDMSKPVVLPLTSSQLSLQCIECHIIFSDHKSKERHLKLSHPAEYEQCILRNALFACYVCDRHFTNSSELMVHQKAHTEKKPFKCPICSQAFKKSSELTSHKKIHFGGDGYACTDCGKPCKTLTLLKYHQRMHTGERPYVCKDCGKRFPMSNTLKKHMLSHLPDGAQGDDAPKKPRAPRKKNDSTPGIKHPCSVCKATFKTLKTRQQHMKNKHKPAAASNAPPGGPRLKHNTPIITPISISQPSLLQVEPNGPLQKVDANVDTDQICRLIESLGNVQKVNQVVILGQVPPHAPPIEVQQVSEPTEMMNLNLSPPQIDFIGLKQTECKTVDLDPSINPMEQTIILEPITPDGQLETPSFSDLGSQLAVGEHIELTLVETEQTEKPQSSLTHQILQQPESDASGVCQNEANDLEQTVILELTPALTPTMELEQSQIEQQHETGSCSVVLSTDQETLDQTTVQASVDEQKNPLPDSSHAPTTESEVKSLHLEQKDLSSCLMTLPDTQASSQHETTSKDISILKKVSLHQAPRLETKIQNQAAQELSENIMEGKSTRPEVKDFPAKEESLSNLQTKQDPPDSELPINVMSAQELVKVRKRKPARAFFFQGYMHDLVGSIYKEDFQFDAKPAKRQRTKKSRLVVKFGPQNKDKKSKKQKKPTQQPQPIQEELIKSKTPGKKFSEKKVQTRKKKGKGKKEKMGGSVVTGGNVKSPSPQAPQVQQVRQNAGKIKIKNQKAAKEGVAHISDHKTVASHMIKKKKTTKMLGKDQPKNAKTGKGKKNEAKQQAEKAEEPGSHVNQDSLLLLKGHKQPQLKVYKLDPSKASNQTPETSPRVSQTVSHTSKSAEGKKKGGRSKKNQKALSLLSSLKASHQLPETVPTKPKTTRKRKTSSKVETEGVITSKRALECNDCGERFSEVSSLQKHKTTAHIVESPSLTYTNGNIFEGVSRLDLYQLPKEHNKAIGVINAPTDWDTEPELAMEDRERSVSFPALIPSPSVTPLDVEISNYNDRGVSKTEPSLQSLSPLEVPSSSDEINRKETPFLAPVQTRSSETGEPLTFGEDKQEDTDMNPISESEVKGTADEDVKEDLLLEVDLVTIGDQNEGDDVVSRADGLNHNESDQGCSSESGSTTKLSEQVCNKTPEKHLTSQTVSCSTHDVEVKEEEEETLVQRKKEIGPSVGTRTDMISNTCSAGNDHRGMEIRNEQNDCQAVFEKHPIFSNLEMPHRGTGTKTGNEPEAIKTTPPLVSLPCISATSEESTDEPVVFELESLSTSVDEVMHEGRLQGREENARECDQSPGNVLERFLTSRHQTTGHMETDRSNQRQASGCVVESRQQILGSQVIKVEENNTDPLRLITSICQSLQVAGVQPEPHQGIRSVLVKEESSSTLNETRAAQDSKRMRWNLEPVRNGTTDISILESTETAGDSPVTPDFSSNQCIFYPVKEEEREVLLGSSHTSRGSSTPEESGNTNEAADCDERERRSSSAEYEETVVRGVLSEPGDGDVTEGQAASDSEGPQPSDIRDFLLQNSDEQDASGFEFSEPRLDREAEILAYFNQNKGSSEHPSQTPANLPTSSQLQAPGAENRTNEPIDYFSKYFGWDTWTEIASCTNELSTLPNPITSTEVARFVGIHIAMGTLKFPSPRLYWEDLTKVVLISEAMPLTRFLELARSLKQTSPSEDPANSDVETSQQQGKASPTAPGLSSHCQSHNSNSSQTDPLWKVQALLHRFNAGCQSLRQQGDYAVDQYLLPLTVKLHENQPSLYCTTLTGFGGLLIHVDLKVDLSDKEDTVEKMVPKGSTVFLCKQELSTPSMLERLLAAGVHGAGRVGGARGQVGDEFVSSDGKLMLRRSYCGFILSTAGNGQRNMASLIDSFEKAQTLTRLSRDLQSLYSIPLTASAPSCWPQAVLWYLTDAALVNSWLLYRQNNRGPSAALTFMAFRLEVSKALILSSSSDTQDSVPPQPPSEKTHTTSETPGPILVEESPLPDASTRYDGSGHWPEQLGEGEGGRCRFGDCQRTSRVLCLKCCVFLCISRNHNCFLNFHNQGSLRKE